MSDYFLSKGSHDNPADGRCAMEWVSYIAGEPHSDAPVCVCPVLRSFGIALNDSMPNDVRQRLRPYLARMIGTAGDGGSQERAYVLADWACREVAPFALDAAGLPEQAAKLRALAPVVDRGTAADAAYAAAKAAADADADAAYAAKAADAADDAAAKAADADADAAYAAKAADAAYAAAKAAADAADAAYAAAAYAADVDAAYAAAKAAYAAYAAAAWGMAFDVLGRVLPTELIEVPHVGLDEASLVCGVVLR